MFKSTSNTRIRPGVTFLLLCLVVFSGCRNHEKTGEGAVAKAFGYYLYPDELEGLVPANASREDSITIVKNYIDNWIRKKVVLHKAEDNLDDDQKEVSRKLEEYRSSLITYAYEAELIRQRLDTQVTEQEINTYYEKNKANFELKDNIIRVLYLRVGKKSPKLDRVRQWYRSDQSKDRALLAEYCHQYAINYFLDDEVWLLFDDLLKEIPIKTYDKEQFLQNNRIIEFEDENSIYLVNIKGFKIKNSISPLSFEKNNIRAMIVNQRKLKLLEDMEKQAYDEARKQGDIDVY